jgi:hypothetical protein
MATILEQVSSFFTQKFCPCCVVMLAPTVKLLMTFILAVVSLFALVRLLRLIERVGAASQIQRAQDQEIVKLKAQLKEAQEKGIAQCEKLREIAKVVRVDARRRDWDWSAKHKQKDNVPQLNEQKLALHKG